MASAKSPKSTLSYLPASTGRLEDRIRRSAALLELVKIQCPAQGHLITVETCQWEAWGNALVQASSAWTAGLVEVRVHLCVDVVLFFHLYFALSIISHCSLLPTWSPPMAKYPQAARIDSLTPVLENWPITKERPMKKIDAAKIHQCGKSWMSSLRRKCPNHKLLLENWSPPRNGN